MGLIKAAIAAASGGLGDAWLESIESAYMGPEIITAPGVPARGNDPRDTNTKKSAQTISNGSIIHVQENQCMLLIDGGKIVDYTAEPGYYKVENSSLPSLMNGQLGEWVKESFNRFRFSGSTPLKQAAYFVNLQEIRGIKFGTPAPVSYFDNTYNAELFLRAYGTYTIRVVDPIKFYREVADKDADVSLTMEDINEQYRNEFLTAFQSALNRYSRDGERIVYITSRGQDLANYMQDALDEKWENERGFVIESVAIASISYDEDSKKLVEMRNKGAMLGDPSIREGYVQGSIARGLEAAGSNEAGAGATFMGMGIGMNAAGQGMGAFSQTNARQMEAAAQRDQAGHPAEAPAPGPVGGETATAEWVCPQCAHHNTGKFCSNCGSKQPEPSSRTCPACQHPVADPEAKFCPDCGAKLS